MESFTSLMTLDLLALALLVGLLSGFVKGVIGFAMPMIFISGLSNFLSPELALAGLIVPTLITNGLQALRQGGRAAWASLVHFKLFMVVGGAFLVLSAQLVSVIPVHYLYLAIGVSVAAFSGLQLTGWRPNTTKRSPKTDVVVGTIAGFTGGMSGIWGPPTVLYLNAINTPKQEQLRVQGIVFGLGAVLLMAAHLQSGVLSKETLPFSALLVLPAVAGMWLGFQVQGRIDQNTFRNLTSCVLLIAGLNLIRRALLG